MQYITFLFWLQFVFFMPSLGNLLWMTWIFSYVFFLYKYYGFNSYIYVCDQFWVKIVYNMKSTLIFPPIRISSYYSTIHWKGFSFPHWIALTSLSKINWPCICDPISGLCFIVLHIQLHANLTVFFIVQCEGERGVAYKKGRKEKGNFSGRNSASLHVTKVKTSVLIQNSKVHPNYSYF